MKRRLFIKRAPVAIGTSRPIPDVSLWTDPFLIFLLGCRRGRPTEALLALRILDSGPSNRKQRGIGGFEQLTRCPAARASE